jgi:ParB/RepB/Spo0J family partition protein
MKVKEYSAKIPVAKIRQSPFHMRKETSEQHLDQLVASIKKHGLIHAVSVVEGRNGRLELANGHRRWLAHKRGKIAEIRANIYEFDPAELADESLRRQAIAEHLLAANSQEALIPIERARYWDEAMEQFGWDEDELARVHNTTPERIADDMMYLNLDPQVFDLAQVHPDSFSDANLRLLAEYSTPSVNKSWTMTPTEQVAVAKELALQTDKKLVDSPTALKTHIKAVVTRRRQNAAQSKRKLGGKTEDPVKALFRLVDSVRKSVEELDKADVSSITVIDPRDKGKATQDLYDLAQQLIDLADMKIGKLKTRKPGTPGADGTATGSTRKRRQAAAAA